MLIQCISCSACAHHQFYFIQTQFLNCVIINYNYSTAYKSSLIPISLNYGPTSLTNRNLQLNKVHRLDTYIFFIKYNMFYIITMYDVKQDTWILDNMLFVRLKNQVVHKQHSHIGVFFPGGREQCAG